MPKHPLVTLSFLLLLKAIVLIAFIVYGPIGLSPDEAQYWTWSKAMDWGYYSKPAGIAAQIWLGTHLFGDTELGVRIVSVLLGFLLPFAVYALARVSLLSAQTAFWAALIIAFSPIGILDSFLAITDGQMILFWTLGCIVIAQGLATQQQIAYYLLGTIILLGALFKWPIYLLWVLLLPFLFLYPYLISRRLPGGILVSLLGLIPTLIWNYDNEWATFRHVTTIVTGGNTASRASTAAFTKGNLFEFLGAQVALFSPVFFALAVMAFIFLIKHRKQVKPPLQFIAGVTLLCFAAYSAMSLFQKVQGNWMAFAYPTAAVVVAWYCCEVLSKGVRWLKIGTALSLSLIAFAFAIPSLQSHGVVKPLAIPYRFSPFHHSIGWMHLTAVLERVGYNPEQAFLFSDKYQTTSVLSFYGPTQKRAYFLNLKGARQNQFNFWPGMAEREKGRDGFFILVENEPHLSRQLNQIPQEYRSLLKNYFLEVQYLGLFPIFVSYGTMCKGAFLFKCTNYNGNEPEASKLW